jgi:cytochrome c-type biogenesis protein CcmF
MTGRVLAAIYGASPGISVFLCTFVMGTIVQEFWRGTAVRMKNSGESLLVALVELVTRAKRRYGGYIVHAGLVAMYMGFTGAAYDTDKEAALRPGQVMDIGPYQIRYDRSRMEVDTAKRMVFTDMTIMEDGEVLGQVHPAKFIYRTHPEMPTTEVAIRSTLRDDAYVIMSSVNPESKLGTFRVIIRPLVAWIWIGGLLLLFGAFVAISPSIKELLESVQSPLRGAAIARPALASWWSWLLALALVFGTVSAIAVLGGSSRAKAQDSSSLMAGNVSMKTPEEKQLFERVLCQCGGCARLPLSGCICHWAEQKRGELIAELAAGKSVNQLQNEYAEQYGAKAIAIPRDKGLDRALWAVPVTAFALAAGGLTWLGRRWVKRNQVAQSAAVAGGVGAAEAADAAMDAALDEELRKLND